MIAYITSDGSKQRPLFVPNYLPHYTAAPTTRRGWTKPTVYAAMTDGSFEKSIEIELPKQEEEAYIAGMEWLADNKTLLVDRVDKTHKRRQIFVVHLIKITKQTHFSSTKKRTKNGSEVRPESLKQIRKTQINFSSVRKKTALIIFIW